MKKQMTIRPIDDSQRKAAKVAGFSGLFAVAIVVFANYALLNPLSFPGNAAETARNLVAHETQLRSLSRPAFSFTAQASSFCLQRST